MAPDISTPCSVLQGALLLAALCLLSLSDGQVLQLFCQAFARADQAWLVAFLSFICW